jgi:hypothetical protein
VAALETVVAGHVERGELAGLVANRIFLGGHSGWGS